MKRILKMICLTCLFFYFSVCNALESTVLEIESGNISFYAPVKEHKPVMCNELICSRKLLDDEQLLKLMNSSLSEATITERLDDTNKAIRTYAISDGTVISRDIGYFSAVSAEGEKYLSLDVEREESELNFLTRSEMQDRANEICLSLEMNVYVDHIYSVSKDVIADEIEKLHSESQEEGLEWIWSKSSFSDEDLKRVWEDKDEFYVVKIKQYIGDESVIIYPEARYSLLSGAYYPEISAELWYGSKGVLHFESSFWCDIIDRGENRAILPAEEGALIFAERINDIIGIRPMICNEINLAYVQRPLENNLPIDKVRLIPAWVFHCQDKESGEDLGNFFIDAITGDELIW